MSASAVACATPAAPGAEDPPGFVVRQALGKASYDNGFRVPHGTEGPWLVLASSTAPGTVWLAGRAPAGPWWLAVSHPGVAAELGPAATLPGPARFVCSTLPALHGVLGRAYRLARS